jgi:YVTN family beta-propeller protein
LGLTAVAVTVTVLVLVIVQPSHQAQTIRVISPPTGASAVPSTVSPMALCKPSESTSPAVAYVTYHVIGAQFHYYVAAVALPSARIRWTVEIPDALPVDAIAVAPGGSTLYTAVGNENNAELLPIDTASGQLGAPHELPGSAPLPQGLAVSPNGRYAMAAQPGDLGSPNQIVGGLGSKVTLIDLADRTVTTTIAVGLGPSGVAFSADSTTAYVTTTQGLRLIDVAQATVTRTFPLSQGGALVVTHGGLALATSQGEDLETPPPTISVVNLNTLQPGAPITLPHPAGGYFAPVAVSCDATVAYALTEFQSPSSVNLLSVVYRIDIANRTVSPLLQLTALPVLAESPDQNQVWAAVATPSCGVAECPTEFIPLGPQATSSRNAVATFPEPIETLAIGPDNRPQP